MPFIDDPRASWGAKATSLTRVPLTDRVGVSWHWIGGGRGPSAAGPHARCLERVKAWQVDHMTRNRWKDIGYNFLICQHARAIEGRGIDYAGSHSPGVNKVHVGVQFMVGEDDAPVTDAMHARAVRLRAELGERCPNIRRDWGHRDDPEAGTECPGDDIWKWVHSGGPTENPLEDDMADYAAQLNEIEGDVASARAEANAAHIHAKQANAKAEATLAALTALAAGLGPTVVKAVADALAADYEAKIELTKKETP